MKTGIIYTALTLLIAAEVYSQNGLEPVYTNDLLGIRQFNSAKIVNDNDKKIFIQINIDNYFLQGGEYYKFDKSNNSVYYAYNGLLNAHDYYSCNNELELMHVESFVVSPQREQIIMFNKKIDCDTIFNDKTYASVNGITREIPVSNCAGIDISLNDSVFYAAGSGDMISYNIYKSTNRGTNWFITDTLSVLRRIAKSGFIKCHPLNENTLFVTGQNNLLISTNSGYNFINTNAPSFEKIYFNGNKLYGIISNKLFTSADNGLSWIRIFSNLTFDFICLEFSSDNAQIIFAGTDAGLFRSTNDGLRFELYNNAFPGSKKVIGLSKDPISNSPLYACTGKGIYKVANAHYESTNFVSPFHIGNFFEYLNQFDNFNNQSYYNVIVVGDTLLSNGIKYFKLQTNYGSSYSYEFIDSISLKWYKYDPYCQDSNELIINLLLDTGNVFRYCNSYHYKITRRGITNTILGDPTFLRYSAKYPPFAIDANEWTYAEKFGFTKSQGHNFVITLTGAIIDGVTYGQIHTSVNNISNVIPEKYELYQNYPNPFNPVTNLEFGISDLGLVSLKVFDISGAEIVTLVNEKLSSGNYKFEFDGSNYASGVYFYKLSANKFSETKRMILLK